MVQYPGADGALQTADLSAGLLLPLHPAHGGIDLGGYIGSERVSTKTFMEHVSV